MLVLLLQRKAFKNNGICRAEFSRDTPFAVAIGASILSSLLLPNTAQMDEDRESAIDSTDTRLTVMGIISFIPYFNWLVNFISSSYRKDSVFCSYGFPTLSLMLTELGICMA